MTLTSSNWTLTEKSSQTLDALVGGEGYVPAEKRMKHLKDKLPAGFHKGNMNMNTDKTESFDLTAATLKDTKLTLLKTSTMNVKTEVDKRINSA